VIEPDLPESILEAAATFAAEVSAGGGVLRDDWLNNGPSSLTDILPPGWRDRLQVLFMGKAIALRTLDRADLLKTKLFALCDRGLDVGDCLALKPTAAELDESLPWLERQDLNPDWPLHVRATVSDLARRLGHGV
jgi:hypothetical protein